MSLSYSETIVDKITNHNQTPLLSVGIPVYNRKDELKFCLESIEQLLSYNIEIVIVDNASDDGTWEYLKTLNHHKIKVFQNEKNIGMGKNWQKCVEYASGQYFMFLMSDDLVIEGSMEKILALLENKDNNFPVRCQQITVDRTVSKIVSTKEVLTDAKVRNVSERLNYLKKMWLYDFISLSALVAHTDIWQKVFQSEACQMLCEQLGRSGHYFDLYLCEKVLQNYESYLETSISTIGYRVYSGNTSKDFTKNFIWLYGGCKYVVRELVKFSFKDRLFLMVTPIYPSFLRGLLSEKHRIFKFFKMEFVLFKEAITAKNTLLIDDENYYNGDFEKL
ncbi:glycosyltransferase [Thiotrichales bacterium 19S3-7]|nr:glycosyltransferase [Thiotrichales bacterium 19S3-7]MCF6800692.1 glycosyltransferase [Thiotrichales bacterium 19S3-11]